MQGNYRYIVAIADAGSISKAAKNAHYSQPALSQRLSQEEQEIGALLLDRRKSPLEPTRAGEIYLSWARRMIESENEMRRMIKGIASFQQTFLRVGFSQPRSQTLLPAAVEDFLNLRPQCTLEIVEAPSATMRTLLDEAAVDLFVGPPHLDKALYSHEDLFEEHIVLAAPSSWNLEPLPGKDLAFPIVRVEQLKDRPFIVPASGSHLRTVLDHILAISGALPRIACSCKSTDLAVSLVERGIGATLCTTVLAKERDASFYLVEGFSEPQPLAVNYRKGYALSDDARVFIDALRRLLQSYDRLGSSPCSDAIASSERPHPRSPKE